MTKETPNEDGTPSHESFIPKVDYHKNGFELRSKLLNVAADFVKWEYEFKYKLGGSSVTIKTPTYQDVLDAAKAWNEFLCTDSRKHSGDSRTFLR